MPDSRKYDIILDALHIITACWILHYILYNQGLLRQPQVILCKQIWSFIYNF